MYILYCDRECARWRYCAYVKFLTRSVLYPLPGNTSCIPPSVPMGNSLPVVCYTHIRGIPYPCTPSTVPMGNSLPVVYYIFRYPRSGGSLTRASVPWGIPCPYCARICGEYLTRACTTSSVPVGIPCPWCDYVIRRIPFLPRSLIKQESGVGGHMLPCQYRIIIHKSTLKFNHSFFCNNVTYGSSVCLTYSRYQNQTTMVIIVLIA